MDLSSMVNDIGILAFAFAGALKARSYRMDVFGALVLAFANAYAGGTLRDVLIGVRPISWINNNSALLLVFGGLIADILCNEVPHLL
jgi:uncharacterized membrane protein YeiH